MNGCDATSPDSPFSDHWPPKPCFKGLPWPVQANTTDRTMRNSLGASQPRGAHPVVPIGCKSWSFEPASANTPTQGADPRPTRTFRKRGQIRATLTALHHSAPYRDRSRRASCPPLADSLILRWFVRDLDVRSSLIASTVHDPLVTLTSRRIVATHTQVFRRMLRDERLYAVGLCIAGSNAPIASRNFPRSLARLEVGAVEGAREVGRRNRGVASRDAEADGVEPLVAQHPAKILEYAWRRSFGDERHQRIMHRRSDQARAHIEVAHEPAQDQRVRQRHGDVRGGSDRDKERNDEAQ